MRRSLREIRKRINTNLSCRKPPCCLTPTRNFLLSRTPFTRNTWPYRDNTTMSTQETPLSNFFCSYNFASYKYDPNNSPADEFERLCLARKWGKAKKDQHYAKFLLAAPREARKPQVATFFRKYEFSKFTHDPSADPAVEFDRLQAARKWGEKNLKKVRKEFQEALGGNDQNTTEPVASDTVILERLPIVEYLEGQQFSGYTYRSGRPEEEFKKLVQAHMRVWEEDERSEGGAIWEAEMDKEEDLTDKELWEMWRETDKFEELHREFYKAVEDQFDLMLDKIAGTTGLRKHEVMVELYCVGKAPISRDDAKIISSHPDSRRAQFPILTRKKRQALRSVHVNIYDFLELVAATINSATEYERQNLIKILSPGARALNFPNDAMLAIYSKCMSRVFPRERANDRGTLILLLRLIKQYFGNFATVFGEFRSEVGAGVVKRAREEGPDAMRKLLLSREWRSLRGIRAMPNILPPGFRRPRGRTGPPPR